LVWSFKALIQREKRSSLLLLGYHLGGDWIHGNYFFAACRASSADSGSIAHISGGSRDHSDIDYINTSAETIIGTMFS